ncbi:MAG: iron-containing alcohol dehydrogenase [bacterium]
MDVIKNFDIMMPTRVVFGRGRLSEIGKLSSLFGKRVMLVTYKDISGIESTIEKTIGFLRDMDISFIQYSEVVPDPPTEIINNGAEIALQNDIDLLIGLGGGSAIDTAKAIAVVAFNGGDAWDYMACNPNCKTFQNSLPVLAVPTTSGTGSEVTAVAVLTSKLAKTKGSVVNPAIFPKVAIVDPELSSTMSPGLTASTGLDAFGHAMEAYISVRATPFVERMAPEAMRLIWKYLPLAYEDGSNFLARANMAYASMLAGMMLAQSGAIGVHAVSQALGAYLKISHGIGVAIATPFFLKYNRQDASEKYIKIAEELGITKENESNEDYIDHFINKIEDFIEMFNISTSLRDISKDVNLDELTQNAMSNAPLSLNNNPRKIAYEDMKSIISAILSL